MKNLFGGLSLLTIALSCLFGCSKKQDFTQRVIYQRTEAKIKGFDPIYSNDTYSSREIAKVYEGLYEFHYLKRPYTLEPNLAEALPTVSKDGLTYTIKIKKGVLFHDDKCFSDGVGREVTANDFVYSLKRVADPKLVSTGFWLIDGKIKGVQAWRDSQKNAEKVDYTTEIEGLKAIDKYTLQFKLTKPFPQFVYALAMTFNYVVAQEAVEMYGKEFLNHPVGTGPFTLKEFNPQATKITYLKNKKFRDKFYPTEGAPGDKEKGLLEDAGKKVPFVDKIVTTIMTEDNPAWLSFMSGEIDALKIPKDNFDQAITPSKEVTDELKTKGVDVIIQKALDVTYSGFNHTDPLFKDNADLRRAISLAYDVDKANKLFYHGKGVAAQSPIPPGIKGYREDYKNPFAGFNLDKAKEYLAKAGYPDGKGLPTIVYETLSKTVSRQMAEFFVKSMKQVGINVKANFNTWPELQKKIKTKSAQMYAISWVADYPDAENFLQLLYGPNSAPGANGSNYNNPTFNKLYEKASKMQDSPERTKLYEKLGKMAAENIPWVYGVHRMDFYLKHGWVKNYKGTEFEHGVEQYWDVDLEKKKSLFKNL
jgi:oligopeptide transport system substrate-binding protein